MGAMSTPLYRLATTVSGVFNYFFGQTISAAKQNVMFVIHLEPSQNWSLHSDDYYLVLTVQDTMSPTDSSSHGCPRR